MDNKHNPPYGYINMVKRLRYQGGKDQQDRMIKDKQKTLEKAFLYSYQGAKVKNIETEEIARALINPNKLKQDYDDKIISIGFDYGYQPGTVFEWLNTNSHWLVYLQDLTELAYFKGDIRKCSYQISWEDEEGNLCSTYVAVRGPVETKINFIQKNGISVDTPNHTLNILMPKTSDTLKYFTRYSRFYLQGIMEEDKQICWRVEATDSISMPGILEITAMEYYSNEIEDDIENGIVGGLIVEPADPEPIRSLIKGENYIKPRREYVYTYQGLESSKWEVPADLPVDWTDNGKSIALKWLPTYSGQFTIKYGTQEKNIIVESLF